MHITLGVYLKLFRMFEYAVKQIDLQIAGELAILQHKITNEEFSLYIEKLKCVHVLEVEIAELDERRELIINELNWFALSQDDHFDEQAYENMLRDVQDNIERKEESIVGLKKECNLLDNVGPCQSSIDLTLKDLGM